MLEEIFKTKEITLSQSEDSGSFIIQFKGEEIEFKLCDLYALKKKVGQLDLVNLMEVSSPDIELIYLPHCDRMLMLDIHDILQFREILNATFCILALNSSIQKVLRKNVFNF